MNIREKLQEYIDQLQIIDTHEHFPVESCRPEKDVLGEWMRHYLSSDIRSAGLSRKDMEEAENGKSGLMNRWKLVEPYWEYARSTGYGRAFSIAANDIYGIPDINATTIEPLNEAFLAARKKGGHYNRVLGEMGRIALCVRDCWEPNEPLNDPRFVYTYRVDDLLLPNHWTQMRTFAEAEGMTVHCLEDWMEVVRRIIERYFGKAEYRVACIKCSLAYLRNLHFPKTTFADAEVAFNEFFRDENLPEWRPRIKGGKPLQDFMLHHICKIADEKGLTMQFHTGIHEGNGNILSDSNSVLLSNLFLEYENIKFDLFHMSYPYMMEAGVLAKNFPNVFLDMCWGHVFPAPARRALEEWLDVVPANKINAFGGDYCFVDGAYGHQRLARNNVAMSLTKKIEEGSFDLDRAKQIAQWLFYENPKRILKLDKFLT